MSNEQKKNKKQYYNKPLSEAINDNRFKLVREAIFIEKHRIKDESIDTTLPKLHRMLRELNDEYEENEKTIIKLFKDVRNYLSHSCHKTITLNDKEIKLLEDIKANIKKKLKDTNDKNDEYKKELELIKKNKLFIEKTKEITITLWGTILLLCLGLDKRLAGEMLYQFGVFKKNEVLRKTMLSFSTKLSMKISCSTIHQGIYNHWQHFCEIISYINQPLPNNNDKDSPSKSYNPRILTSQMVDYFVLRWFELNRNDFGIEFAHGITSKNRKKKSIKKPYFCDSEEFKKRYKKIYQNTENSDSEEFEERSEEIYQNTENITNHNLNELNEDEKKNLAISTIDYFTNNHQYWMRVQSEANIPNNSDNRIKIHRKQLIDLALMFWKQCDKKQKFLTLMFWKLCDKKQKFKDFKDIRGKIMQPITKFRIFQKDGTSAFAQAYPSSTPRTMQQKWKRKSLKERKQQRIKRYEKIIEVIENNKDEKDKKNHLFNTLHWQADSILWGLQHGIGIPFKNNFSTKKSLPYLTKEQYHELNKTICKYSEDTSKFKGKVIRCLRDCLKDQVEKDDLEKVTKWIRSNTKKTVIGLTKELIDRLENCNDHELPNPDQQLRPSEPDQQKHFLKKPEKNDHLAIPWLPKEFFKPNNGEVQELLQKLANHSFEQHKNLNIPKDKQKETSKQHQKLNISESEQKKTININFDKMVLEIVEVNGDRIPIIPIKKDFNKQYLQFPQKDLIIIYEDYKDYKEKQGNTKSESFTEYINTEYISKHRIFLKHAINKILELEEKFIEKNDLKKNKRGYISFEDIINAEIKNVNNDTEQKNRLEQLGSNRNSNSNQDKCSYYNSLSMEEVEKITKSIKDRLDHLICNRNKCLHYYILSIEDVKKITKNIDELCRCYELTTLTEEMRRKKERKEGQRKEFL